MLKKNTNDSRSFAVSFGLQKDSDNFSSKIFTYLELQEHSDMRSNSEYYNSAFSTRNKEYFVMSDQEKKDFKKFIEKEYYVWLALNDSIINLNPILLQLLSQWIISGDKSVFFHNINNNICRACREYTKIDNTFDADELREIHSANMAFIAELNVPDESIIDTVKKIVQEHNTAPAAKKLGLKKSIA